MATVVLVHGIAQEQVGSATLEETWLPALADGVAEAGDHTLADRIWRAGVGDFDIRMAYYGTPFIDDGAQGLGDVDLATAPLEPSTEQLAEQLAVAWLRVAARSARDPSDRRQARRELAVLVGEVGEAQGWRGRAGRPALNALARLRWFAPFGMAVASTFVWRALTQVSRYLTDDDLRDYAQGQVLQNIDPDTRLVIGHSLGSVVAYESVHRAREAGRLPADGTLTLVTLGSPLALQGVVYHQLRPQPPHVPPAAARWENFAAEDDLVAAHLDLAPYFPSAPGATVRPADHVVDTGSKPHEVTHYLTKPSLGRVVAGSLVGCG